MWRERDCEGGPTRSGGRDENRRMTRKVLVVFTVEGSLGRDLETSFFIEETSDIVNQEIIEIERDGTI